MNLNNLLPFAKPSQLLVCETNGFSLRGTVLARTGDDVTVMHNVTSQQADMAAAVTELISQLKAEGWRGGQAILLSPAVLSTLVELPVDPKKPRPVNQMQELVRWEVEPLLMQHTTQWTVGHMLVGKGYMTEEQAKLVMDTQQGRANPTGELDLAENFSMRRFGDLAIQLGYIDKSQLDTCLAGQEWLKSDDEVIECGWSPQAEIADSPGVFNWLVSCVNQSLLQRWVAAFQSQNVTLKAMYPLTGCSGALLTDDNASQVMLESHADMAFVMQVSNGHITAQHQYINPTKQAIQSCLESYHALNPPASDPVWLASWHEDSELLADELLHVLHVDLKLLNPPPVDKQLSPGMLGAAWQAFGISDADRRCAQVRVGGPLPPPLQRLEVRAAVLAAALLLVIAGTETVMMIQKHSAESYKAKIDAQWKSIDEAVKQVNAVKEQIEKRETQLKQQKADQARLEARLNFFGNEIPERAALIQTVLGVLQSTVSGEIIVNRIDELGKRVPIMPAAPNKQSDTRVEVENFNLEAWALSETAAQAFIQQMKEALVPWNMEVRDSQVMSRPGPLNLDGFAVAMRLVKLASIEATGEKK
ncbi:hypothetical protein [Methylophaga sp. OBS4]|uniref:hypothetical protein n=1 Tax=Methylophaga sp. OBS4 TaxID=2991935 RepID=UPI002250645C|nr:hypothetical protein [Methylophaga sp. OBS4]MCX4187782.1 hypothetical protein [Methylophaga sp. OBS4]